jgi:hypothetical protein
MILKIKKLSPKQQTKESRPLPYNPSPSFYLDEKVCPGIAKLEVGETVSVAIQAKVVSVSSRDTIDGGKTESAELKVVKGEIDTKEPVDMEDATRQISREMKK